MSDLFQSYLFSLIFWVSLSLGCFGLLLLHHTIRGKWGLPLLRFLEAGSMTLVLMGVLFLVVFAGLPYLYPWARPEEVAKDPILQHRAGYYQLWFFAARFALYFVIWILIAWLLIRWTGLQEKTGDSRYAQKRTNLSAPAIIAYAVTVTFASTDWVMSLDAHWSSTMFGFLYMASQALTAMAFVIFLLTWRASQKPYSEVVNPALTRDLGNILLAFTLLWAYLSFSQYLIIWSANLPELIPYYIKRNKGGWNWLPTAMLFGQFFVPFLLLLIPSVKAKTRNLMIIAGWILVWRIVDVFWQIIPVLRPDGFSIRVTDPIVFVAIGALWMGFFFWQLKQRSPLPTHDPRLQEALEHA
jgi:hypothetical protein